MAYNTLYITSLENMEYQLFVGFDSSAYCCQWSSEVHHIKDFVSGSNDKIANSENDNRANIYMKEMLEWMSLVSSFVDKWGHHRVPRDIRRMFNQAMEMAGCPPVNFGPDQGNALPHSEWLDKSKYETK